MRKVRCYECGKTYDFDIDDFCPRCGAFNQPLRSTRIGTDGTVIRVDGINERNHKNSFVHAELHEENRERKAVGLSKGIKRTAKAAASRPVQAAHQRGSGKSAGKGILTGIAWIIFAVIVLNILGDLILLFI